MVRLSDGDRTAFGPLFSLTWRLLSRFAQRSLPSADAEDAAQQALLKVFSRAAEFDPRRDALSWILGVVAFECRTQRQKIRRRKEAFSADAEADPLLALASPGPSPEQELAERELLASALESLGSLSPDDIKTILIAVNDE